LSTADSDVGKKSIYRILIVLWYQLRTSRWKAHADYTPRWFGQPEQRKDLSHLHHKAEMAYNLAVTQYVNETISSRPAQTGKEYIFSSQQ